MSIEKINNDVVAIKTHMMDNNTYIMLDNDKAIIVDPSFAGQELIQFFKQNKAIKPIAIILTHAHFDHCNDTAMFLQEFNVPVYIHKLDKITYEKYDYSNLVGLTLKRFDNNVKYFDGGELKIDSFNLSIILTPGHTTGSITIVWKDYAFVGDTLFYNSYGRIDFANSSPKDMKESIKTLFKVLKEEMYILTGHSEWAKLKEIKKVNFMAKELIE